MSGWDSETNILTKPAIIDHRRIAEDADILRLLHDELHKCVDDAFGPGTKESQAYAFNPKLCYDGDVLDGVIGFLACASESASGNDLEKDLVKSKTSKAARELLQKLFSLPPYREFPT